MVEKKALVLFSGGLDSLLAAKLLQEQRIEVEGLYLKNPFITTPLKKIKKIAAQINLKTHFLNITPDFFQKILTPQHGLGKNLNPCLDCRLYLLSIAKKFAKKKYFLATGEVLGERPFSQNRTALEFLDKKANLKGKILRPLSAQLLPETQMEKQCLVQREKLLSIKGRSRKPQLTLVKKWGLKNFLTPSGGCLLTDPAFCRKAQDFFDKKLLNQTIVNLLKLGRHFNIQNQRVIIGRNEQENIVLETLAQKNHLPFGEAKNYPSPIGLIFPLKKTPPSEPLIKTVSKLIAFYSDAPPQKKISVFWKNQISFSKIVTKSKKLNFKPL